MVKVITTVDFQTPYNINKCECLVPTPSHLHTLTPSPQQLSKSSLVGRVLHDSQLDGRAKLLPESVKVLLVQLLDHVQRLPHELLTNDLEKLVLLQRLARHVKREVI